MSSETNRRSFIFNGLKVTAGLAGLSTLSACSTLDEYLFEDSFYVKDQVMIAGGGLSGLYLAYKLRQNKNAFRLFEGSSRLGGRIHSVKQIDFGASLYHNDDEMMKALIKELDLTSNTLDKNHYYLANGMQELTDRLVERIQGLIAYRSVRVRWKLVSVHRINRYLEVVFQTPEGRQRTFVGKKLALAIPPTQWASIDGLSSLEEMKPALAWASSLRKENTVKVVLTPQQLFTFSGVQKNLTYFEDETYQARQVIKKNKTGSWVEIDFKANDEHATFEIEKLNDFMKKKMDLSFSATKMAADSYLDWSHADLIHGSAFTNVAAMPEIKSSMIQVVGDFASAQKVHTLEGALQSVAHALEYLA